MRLKKGLKLMFNNFKPAVPIGLHVYSLWFSQELYNLLHHQLKMLMNYQVKIDNDLFAAKTISSATQSHNRPHLLITQPFLTTSAYYSFCLSVIMNNK